MRTSKLTLTLLSLGLAGCFLQAQEEGKHLGKVYIPGTSLEQAGDAGQRVHTNHRILIEPSAGLGPKGGMTPAQLRTFYGVPATKGTGLPAGAGTIFIVDAYDYPTALADFNVFSNYFGLPAESSTNATASGNKVFQVVYASGKKPRANGGWAQEAALDIEWAHAMAPGAKIVLVEAASASFSDMYAAVDKAVSLAAPGDQVSMSWGGSETSGETANDSHFTNKSVIFFASAGDTGAQVIYPSASAYVVSVGGTSVATDAGGYTITTESAWSSGGGGVSAYVPLPAFQTGIKGVGARRTTPDISSDADPATGVAVYDSYSYQGYSGWMVFGGTSVSSPCMAGMLNAAESNGATKWTSTSAFLAHLYSQFTSTTDPYRDILSGSNGFAAAAGYDWATGIGAPTGVPSF